MTLVAAGYEAGNGFSKLCIGGKVSKIPAGYALFEPQGAVSAKTGARVKAKAFHLQVGEKALWFGQDALGAGLVLEIDGHKYDPKHIRLLFAANVVKLAKQHKLDPAALGILRVVCSMPPEQYQDARLRAQAETAYKAAFTVKNPWYVRSNLFETFRLQTVFGGLEPEAASYVRVNQTKPGFTVICDLGYGTVDYCVFREGGTTPLVAKSQNNGLVQVYTKIDEVDQNQAELTVLREGDEQGYLLAYFNSIKNKLASVVRVLPQGGRISVVVIGGGVKLMPQAVKQSWRAAFGGIVFKDEFTNVRSNWELAKNETA